MSSTLKVDILQDSGGNNLVTSNGSGVITAAGFGKVGQVVETSSSTKITSTSTTRIQLLSLNITPSNTSSKILLMASANGAIDGNTNGYYGVSLFDGTVASGTKIQEAFEGSQANEDAEGHITLISLQSPSTTSQKTYSLGFRTASSGTTSVHTGNEPYNIIAMEILP